MFEFRYLENSSLPTTWPCLMSLFSQNFLYVRRIRKNQAGVVSSDVNQVDQMHERLRVEFLLARGPVWNLVIGSSSLRGAPQATPTCWATWRRSSMKFTVSLLRKNIRPWPSRAMGELIAYTPYIFHGCGITMARKTARGPLEKMPPRLPSEHPRAWGVRARSTQMHK